jgi:hypothetical protein
MFFLPGPGGIVRYIHITAESDRVPELQPNYFRDAGQDEICQYVCPAARAGHISRFGSNT